MLSRNRVGRTDPMLMAPWISPRPDEEEARHVIYVICLA